MDYEKKYKEALKRARANYKADKEMGFLENCDMLELIFPELAESEDERIRMELKEAFEAYDIESKWNGIPVRSIFAWLEKQKEQKPAWSEEDEKMLKCRLIAINHYEKTCNIGDHLPTKFNIDGYLASVDKVKSWLKSLPMRCSKSSDIWKPSEEQMKALEAATVRYQSTGLESLYEDLKKL